MNRLTWALAFALAIVLVVVGVEVDNMTLFAIGFIPVMLVSAWHLLIRT